MTRSILDASSANTQPALNTPSTLKNNKYTSILDQKPEDKQPMADNWQFQTYVPPKPQTIQTPIPSAPKQSPVITQPPQKPGGFFGGYDTPMDWLDSTKVGQFINRTAETADKTMLLDNTPGGLMGKPMPTTGNKYADTAANLLGTAAGFIAPGPGGVSGPANALLKGGSALSEKALPKLAPVARKAMPILDTVAAKTAPYIGGASLAINKGLPYVAKKATQGAMMGATYGTGSALANDVPLQDIPKEAVKEAAMWAALDVGGSAIGKALSPIISKYYRPNAKILESLPEQIKSPASELKQLPPANIVGLLSPGRQIQTPDFTVDAFGNARAGEMPAGLLPAANVTEPRSFTARLPEGNSIAGLLPPGRQASNFTVDAFGNVREGEGLAGLLPPAKTTEPRRFAAPDRQQKLAIAQYEFNKATEAIQNYLKHYDVLSHTPPGTTMEEALTQAEKATGVNWQGALTRLEKAEKEAGINLRQDLQNKKVGMGPAVKNYIGTELKKPGSIPEKYVGQIDWAKGQPKPEERPLEFRKTVLAKAPKSLEQQIERPLEFRKTVLAKMPKAQVIERPLEFRKTVIKQNPKNAVEQLNEISSRVAASEPITTGALEPQPTTPNRPKNSAVQSTIVPGLKEFIDQDVVPVGKDFASGLKETLDKAVKLISPRTGAPERVLNPIMEMKGQRERKMYELDQQVHDTVNKTGEGIRNYFASIPETERIEFMDNYKRGKKQSTPEKQAIADFYKKLDDETYKELQKYKPSLAFKENHFRIFWKEIPGAKGEGKGWFGTGRRPLQGTRGMLKHATLEDVSEGIAKGGVPASTNPHVLFEMGQADAQKFITAHKMWEALKGQNDVKFIRFGKRAPEGFVRLEDNLARVYFPAPEGLVNAGEYYIEENAGRLLNNYLSRDLIRESAAGKGMLWIKNNTTAMELALSPFHATFETIESIGANIGVGYSRIFNEGQFLKGLQDIVTSPKAPRDLARTGGSLIRYINNKEDFLKTTRGQELVKKYPEIDHIINELFSAGAKLKMSEDYRIDTARTLKENISSGNYIGAMIRALPALNDKIMQPLFDTYIPRLKLGLWLKEYGQQLEQHADNISAGKMSRAKIAQNTWDRVENRFGEMNFDNMFWNRTFKSSLQMLFRSVTWKLGDIRMLGGAAKGQAAEFAEPLKLIASKVTGKDFGGRAPKLDPNMAGVLGMLTIHAVIGTILNKTMTGEWPQTLKDVAFPRTGNKDQNGNDIRLGIPTYLKDVISMAKSPTKYVISSLSGVMSKSIDAMNNRDYFGNFIYNSNEPTYKKLLDSFGYIIPKPFSFTNLAKMQQEKTTPATKALSFMGFTQAPKEYIQSDFQKQLSDVYAKQRPKMQLTPEQQEKNKAKKELRDKIYKGKFTDKDIQDAIDKGIIKEKGLASFMQNAELNSMQTMWKYLKKSEKERLYNLASPEEKKMLDVVD